MLKLFAIASEKNRLAKIVFGVDGFTLCNTADGFYPQAGLADRVRCILGDDADIL